MIKTCRVSNHYSEADSLSVVAECSHHDARFSAFCTENIVLMNSNLIDCFSAGLKYGMYSCRLKVFVPLMVWGFVVLIPVNKTDNELVSFQSTQANVTYSRVDTLSIANVHDLSKRCAQILILFVLLLKPIQNSFSLSFKLTEDLLVKVELILEYNNRWNEEDM